MKKIEGKRIHVGIRLFVAEHHALKQKALDSGLTVQALLYRMIQAAIQG